jgi:hypothetical protein
VTTSARHASSTALQAVDQRLVLGDVVRGDADRLAPGVEHGSVVGLGT